MAGTFINLPNYVTGPGSAVANNFAAFDGTSGSVIKDSGISMASMGDVVGPASSTDNAFARWDGTTGKLLQNSTAATLSDTGVASFLGVTSTNDMTQGGNTVLDTTDIGVSVQAYNLQLTDIAALAVTDGNIIVGNGTTWVAESGATARASLGLTIGTNVQAYSANLAAIAALSVTDGNIIVGDGATWVAESGATARTSLGLGTGNSPQFTGLTLSGLTATRILYAGTSGVISDDSALLWNATSNWLGLNMTPTCLLSGTFNTPANNSWTSGAATRASNIFFTGSFSNTDLTGLNVSHFGLDLTVDNNDTASLNYGAAQFAIRCTGTSAQTSFFIPFSLDLIFDGSAAWTKLVGERIRLLTYSGGNTGGTVTEGVGVSFEPTLGDHTYTTVKGFEAKLASGNHSRTMSEYRGFTVAAPTKGASYTYTTWTGLHIEDNTVTTTNKIGVRQVGTNAHNRFNGSVKIGADSAPTVALDVTGAITATGNLTINSEALVVDATNFRTYVNCTLAEAGSTITPQFNVVNRGTGDNTAAAVWNFTNSSSLSPSFRFYKSRSATTGTLTETQSGDAIGGFSFFGVTTGSTAAQGAIISAAQDGASGASNVPMKLNFWTDTGSSLGIRMVLDAAGQLLIDTTTTIAKAGLALQQDDADEPFIHYDGTSAANANNNITTWTTGATLTGYIRVQVEGTDYWMPYYTAPTS